MFQCIETVKQIDRCLIRYAGNPASKLQPMLSTNKVLHAEDTFCCRDYMCQVSKLQHMYVIGLVLFSVLKTTKHTWLYPATYYCTRLHQAAGCTTAPGCTRLLTPPCPPLFSLVLYYEHIMNLCFSSKFASRIPSVLSSFLQAI